MTQVLHDDCYLFPVWLYPIPQSHLFLWWSPFGSDLAWQFHWSWHQYMRAVCMYMYMYWLSLREVYKVHVDRSIPFVSLPTPVGFVIDLIFAMGNIYYFISRWGAQLWIPALFSRLFLLFPAKFNCRGVQPYKTSPCTWARSDISVWELPRFFHLHWHWWMKHTIKTYFPFKWFLPPDFLISALPFFEPDFIFLLCLLPSPLPDPSQSMASLCRFSMPHPCVSTQFFSEQSAPDRHIDLMLTLKLFNLRYQPRFLLRNAISCLDCRL